MKVCENEHKPCSFADYDRGYLNVCPACAAKEEGVKSATKAWERVRQLENEIDHLYVCVVNQKRK